MSNPRGFKSEPGYVHPETRLEFASRESFEQGGDPIPHWRNAQIKRINAQSYPALQGSDEIQRQREARISALYAYFDRHGKDTRGKDIFAEETADIDASRQRAGQY